MASKTRSFLLRVLLVVGLLAGAIYAGVYSLRPQAIVRPAAGGVAVNSVPGSVVVRAERDEELRVEVGGRVVKTAMDDGKFFKKGDFMVQLDGGDLQLEIERTELELKALQQRIAVDKTADLELETAKGEFENATRIHKQGMMSDFDYQKKERELRQMEQRLAAAKVKQEQEVATLENTLKTRQRQLDKMTILAPFDCVISKLYSRENALVSPGAPLALLISVNRTVEAKISEENFAGVRLGQKATVRFLGYEGTYEATVEKMLPTADPETQRYIVHLNVEIDRQRLVPGITGEVNIILGERQAQCLVPRRALVGQSVFVVAGGKVEKRKVTLGYVGLSVAEVLDGVKPGELLVIEAVDQFRDGQSVRPLQR